jgi:hypothetical protein
MNVLENNCSCVTCGKIFDIPEQMARSIKNEIERRLSKPPKGAWVKEKNGRLRIGVSTKYRSDSFFLLLFVGLAFSPSVPQFFMTLYAAVSSGSHISISLFYFIFVVISCVLIWMAIYSWFGKVELIICKESYVFIGVGIIGIKKYVDFNTVRRIYPLSFINSDSEGRQMIRKIIIEDEKNIEISMQFINAEKRIFLLKILQYKKAKLL